MKQTQHDKILAVLEAVRSGDHDIPDEFLLRHKDGDGLSGRYFKRVLWITECNGRITELRTKLLPSGRTIESSKTKDEFGFVYHRLIDLDHETVGRKIARGIEWFDSLPEASEKLEAAQQRI